jgi:hypothetical protein
MAHSPSRALGSRRLLVVGVLTSGLLVGSAAIAAAQVTVQLPDTSQTTTLTANVSEQARVAVPASVTFTVGNTALSTAASAASITIDHIVLATATKQLKISVQADAANFTPPTGGATTWAATDVTWNAASWTSATGSSGTLSNSAFNTVATCTANASSCSTTALVFTLGAKAAVQAAGSHTLSITWKVGSIGS